MRSNQDWKRFVFASNEKYQRSTRCRQLYAALHTADGTRKHFVVLTHYLW
jgi:hypothetical protein